MQKQLLMKEKELKAARKPVHRRCAGSGLCEAAILFPLLLSGCPEQA